MARLKAVGETGVFIVGGISEGAAQEDADAEGGISSLGVAAAVAAAAAAAPDVPPADAASEDTGDMGDEDAAPVDTYTTDNPDDQARVGSSGTALRRGVPRQGPRQWSPPCWCCWCCF